MNVVTLIGRLTKDIDMREYGKGKNAGVVGSFRLAVKDGVDSDGNERTVFVNVTAWNRTAEIVRDYCGKGKLLAVSGRLVNNDYEKEDGTKVYQTEVVAATVELIAPKSEDGEAEKVAKGGKYNRRS